MKEHKYEKELSYSLENNQHLVIPRGYATIVILQREKNKSSEHYCYFFTSPFRFIKILTLSD